VPAPLIECVPNVSEGRDRDTLERLAAAVRAVPSVVLADVHADPDHHRSVFTFLGPPAAVERAALALADAALPSIDMRAHRGIHPRLGALDVLPFVPLRGMTMADAAALARAVGRTLGERHRLPVYFYGAAALNPARRSLPAVRAGEYEGLPRKLADPGWQPDAGPAVFSPKSGAVIVGARDALVAFNVWLDSDDLAAARAIARAVRESSGGLPAVQALGVALPSRGCVQVSMNLLDYRRTPLPRAWDVVSEEATRRGIRVMCGELVGLLPRAALAGRSPESVGLAGLDEAQYLDSYLPPG
jgi:glutamate formiminotransferase